MKKTFTVIAAALWMGTMCISAQAEGAPKIQFDRLVYDFGKTSHVETVSGIFKVKNVGDGILKLEAPKPACGCTVAEMNPNTLKPGETGELPFTLNLGLVKAVFDKQIVVKSNDPQTPEATLSIKVDYTPLYDINPMALSLDLAFGVNAAEQFTTLTRTDGKPLGLLKLTPSKPWITATVDPGTKTNEATARIRIAIRRDGPSNRFNELVHIYTAEQPNKPVSSIYLSGQIMGEVSLSPEALYWSVPGGVAANDARPEGQTVQRVTVRAANGKAIEIKNVKSTIKGLNVELVTKEAGKSYELVASLDELPAKSISGIVSFETSIAAHRLMEVPVIVNVSKP